MAPEEPPGLPGPGSVFGPDGRVVAGAPGGSGSTAGVGQGTTRPEEPGVGAPGGSGTTAGVPRILLIGMMGAGKTTVGRRLSQLLGWPYLDSDAEVVASTGRTVPELFAERGEPAFRAEEARVLAEACAAPGPAIVSVAGGAVLAEGNRVLLRRSGCIVWLRADPATLARRVGTGHGRPLLDTDPAGALRALYEERRPVYESLAEVVVDVDRRSVDEVVEQVLAGAGLAGQGPAEPSADKGGLR